MPFFTGTANLNFPIFSSPCRGFSPNLDVSYNSGVGNGLWGLGTELSLPSISRKISQQIPQYQESDIFLWSGADNLAAVDGAIRNEILENSTYIVQTYRPCVGSSYVLIEWWQPENTDLQNASFWRTISPDHIISIYGKTDQARVFDPQNPDHIFQWLLEEVYDTQGQHQLYFYKPENTDNIPSVIYEQDRNQTTNKYLQCIRYGHVNPLNDSMLLTQNPAVKDPSRWHFEIVFNYGEYTIDPSNTHPYIPAQNWLARIDPFSTYHAGFEIRTHRLCQHTLMFHRFDELGTEPVLVHATNYQYQVNTIGVNQLIAIQETGYHYDTQKESYSTRSLPLLELSYIDFEPEGHEFSPLTKTDGSVLSGLSEFPNYDLVDVYGEGIPGILYSDTQTTYYQDPVLSNFTVENQQVTQPIQDIDSTKTIAYSPPGSVASFPIQRTVNQKETLLMDITGNGQLDLLVSGQGLKGYYEVNSDRFWETYQPFESFAESFYEEQQQWVDVTGNGIPDLLQLNQGMLRIFPSQGPSGFGKVLLQQALDDFPSTLQSDPVQAIQFADMAGAGTPQLVKVTNGNVTYWPSLGYGRFGKAIQMGNAPQWGADFSTERLFFADIDGSGTTDLIYAMSNQVLVYLNRGGNTFNDPIPICLPAQMDSLNQIQFADVYGQGTTCLIFSERHAITSNSPRYWCYDFAQQQKPYLLQKIDNNMGATTEIRYRSSVDDYLQDKMKGLDWITNLPFPVLTVGQIIHTDAISNTQMTSMYRYHHGYYDGIDREFRGFGMVEQQDSQYFPSSNSKTVNPDYVSPTLTKTWFHTGAYQQNGSLGHHYSDEYNQADSQAFDFPESVIDYGIYFMQVNEETTRQTYRALKGTVLRTEVYGLDESLQQNNPYSVSESNYQVELQQPLDESHPYAIFQVNPRETLSYVYERNPQDPQIHHQFILQMDDYGNITRSCAVAYPRRDNDGALPEQQILTVSCTTQSYVNQAEVDRYLLGVPIENQSYEITGLTAPQNQAFQFDALNTAIQTALSTVCSSEPSSDQAVLLSWDRLYYASVGENSQTLPLYSVTLPLLLGQHQVAEFSQLTVAKAFAGVLEGDALTNHLQQGHYQQDTKTSYWWNPGSTETYFDSDQWYLPQQTQDAAGYITSYAYDSYNLMLVKVTDALNNQTQGKIIDYQHLQPTQLIDANNNTSEVLFDPLGHVVYTSYYGQEHGVAAGFAPLSEAPVPESESLQDILNNPSLYLGKTQSYFYYDAFAWVDRQEPPVSLVLTAESYEDPLIQIQLSYSDGFGRICQNKQKVESGDSLLYNSNTQQITQGSTENRWLTSGRVRFNNKGNAVEQYEPYFIDTPNFLSNDQLDTFGVSATLYYDPLDRVTQTLTPKGFWLSPQWDAWQQVISDANDNILTAPYYLANNPKDPKCDSPYYDPNLSDAEKQALVNAAVFANTPSRKVMNNLGQVILEEEINVSNDNSKPVILQTQHTYDIQGRLLTSADPRLRACNLTNYTLTYGLTGPPLQTVSADAGTSWLLTNVFGNPLYSYDQRKVGLTVTYDALQRPVQSYVQKTATPDDPLALDQIVERVIYGDTPGVMQHPEQYNFRGQVFQHYDQAGLVTVSETAGYSLLGQPFETHQQFRDDYKNEANWNDINSRTLQQLLQSTVYSQQSVYDALGRVIQATDADNNQQSIGYLLSGHLGQLSLLTNDDKKTTLPVQNITYNAKGQRISIRYGNGLTTNYQYEQTTWALQQLQTGSIQNLSYVHDPVGNVVQKTDAGQPTVFYNNQQVSSVATYTYNALYQLLQATGREQQTSAGNSDLDVPLPRPTAQVNDTQALQNYTENYTYDDAGNLTQTQHVANNNNWTRQMIVSDTSNRAVISTINGNSTPTPQEVDQYFDLRGNQLNTGQINPLAWNYRDNIGSSTTIERISGKNDAEYYVYDSSGQRVRKVSEQYGNGGTTVTVNETLYLGNLEIRRTLSGTDPAKATVTQEYHALRVMDDTRCILTRDHWVVGYPPSGFTNPTLLYHLEDLLGSYTVETDAQGNVVCTEEYAPYGGSTLFVGSGSAAQLRHYRYSGKEKDSFTGLYYYGARYYAPGIGRWLSPDPAGTIDGLNVYAFVSGNPITFMDAGGMCKTKKGQARRRGQTRGARDKNSTTVGGGGGKGTKKDENDEKKVPSKKKSIIKIPMIPNKKHDPVTYEIKKLEDWNEFFNKSNRTATLELSLPVMHHPKTLKAEYNEPAKGKDIPNVYIKPATNFNGNGKSKYDDFLHLVLNEDNIKLARRIIKGKKKEMIKEEMIYDDDEVDKNMTVFFSALAMTTERIRGGANPFVALAVLGAAKAKLTPNTKISVFKVSFMNAYIPAVKEGSQYIHDFTDNFNLYNNQNLGSEDFYNEYPKFFAYIEDYLKNKETLTGNYVVDRFASYVEHINGKYPFYPLPTNPT
jgi:RHS repeat-associated protein